MLHRKHLIGAALVPAALLGGCGLDLERGSAPIGIAWDCQDGTAAENAACKQDRTRRYPGQTVFESAPAWFRFWPLNARTTLESSASGGERMIEEGDIVQRSEDNKTMYVLNPYRGLLILNIENPDRAVVLGRLRIQGNPAHMYVREGTAYVLMNDYYDWRAETPKYGARVLAIDVSNPSRPELNPTATEIRGSMTDSRFVGDVLYVVSNSYDYQTGESAKTHFTSVDVGTMQAIEEKPVDGNGWLIHVADAASCDEGGACYIFVTKNDWNENKTTVQAVDISDPNGALAIGAEVDVQGSVQNRFHMSFDGTHLRVVSHDWNWGATDSDRGTIYVQAFNTTAGMRTYGALALRNIGGLDAARFAGNRAYLSHTVQVDPLDVIDLANPDQPGSWNDQRRLLGRIDIPGRLARIEVVGDRLLAIGSENERNQVAPTNSCDGYTWTAWQPGEGFHQSLAAAIYDVSNPAEACEAGRVRFGDDSWSWSNAFYDDKALTFMNAEKLLLMPFYRNGKAVLQMITVDLPAKRIAVAGQVENGAQVDRSDLVNGRLLALSSTELVVADVSDRDNPRVTKELELARNVAAFERVSFAANKEFGIQLVDEYDGNAELRVVALANPDGMGADVKGSAPIGHHGGALYTNSNVRVGNEVLRIATVISHDYLQPTWDEHGNQLTEGRTDTFLTNFRVYSDGRITKVGELELRGYNPDLNSPSAEARRWGGLESVQRIQRGGVDLFVIASTTDTNGRYVVISNKTPASPVKTFETTGDAQGIPANTTIEDLKVASDGNLYVVSYYTVPTTDVGLPEPVPLADQSKAAAAAQAATPANTSIMPPVWRPERQRVLYHVTKVTFDAQGQPTLGPNVNVPGRLVDVSGDYMTFLDNRWAEIPAPPPLPPVCLVAHIDCSAEDLSDELAQCCNTDPVPFQMTDEQRKAIFTARIGDGVVTLADGIDVDSGTENVMVRGRDGSPRSSAYYTVANWGWRGPIMFAETAVDSAVEVEAPEAMATSIMPPRVSSFKLVILDFQDFDHIQQASEVAFDNQFGGGGNLLDARDVQLTNGAGWTRMAFLTLGSALAVYNVEDKANPRLANLTESQSWFAKLLIDGRAGRAFAASGYTGVLEFNLRAQQ